MIYDTESEIYFKKTTNQTKIVHGEVQFDKLDKKEREKTRIDSKTACSSVKGGHGVLLGMRT